ncbi:MAG: Fe-S cluster assembly protein SufD [Xanthomonadales bacterium]|nr:Fe-S cluster assembly protein SufD [Xanthomonadales bacterium]
MSDWLTSLRNEGARHFERYGLPGRDVEEWKYTPVTALPQASVKRPAAAGNEDPGLVADLTIYMSDGYLVNAGGSRSEGVKILSLEQALEAGTEGLRTLLESLDISQRWQSLSALNAAGLGPGLVIHVADGVDAGRIAVTWNGSAEGRLAQTRVCILLGDGARLNLAEIFTGDGWTLNGVWQAQVGGGARLEHVRVTRAQAGVTLLSRVEARLEAGARYDATILDLGDGLTRHDVRPALVGPGASCRLDGAIVTGPQSHADHHFEADHQASGCQSEQFWRAVASGQGKAVFNGRVHIAPGADDSESQQSSAGLLMSKQAEIDAKPELEIYADEVVASHGATVGQLDEQALFYLQTRGIERGEARRILTLAFCRPVSDRIEDARWREKLGQWLAARMEQSGIGHE